jgi:glycosyltransferase involved in cell wall biosynthesis
MMWGLPVVATSVAAEGVAEPELFLTIADDAEGIARALVTALQDPGSAETVRERAYRWSHDRYSAAAYVRSLEEVYG